ncbi:thioredoxin family Trp26 protein [Cardiosporidium cionae]|uniref:Thioredoxin family Trp26 protein n=1 Tax=Cardiosporidium cionae TaxID=476202 RepID=A0ABQ7JFB8_9APIC|nr:thioredoxin family Trp26 protein [Cardiosporidium cionae]|eukprot:KAF8822649.1 thioredoxin family Trp26 protein [Cardiosporidium cionae]
MPGEHGPGCGCKHQKELLGAEFLLPFIQKETIRGFNEKVPGTAKGVFKAYDSRLDESKFCDSMEGDPELMISLSFISPCKISSIHLIGGDHSTYPTAVKLYVDKENLDFSALYDSKPSQEISLMEDFHGSIEYPVKVSKFANVSHLTLFFPENAGGDFTRIYYIGLRGQGSNLIRKPVITVYEARPNVADHEVRGDTYLPHLGL